MKNEIMAFFNQMEREKRSREQVKLQLEKEWIESKGIKKTKKLVDKINKEMTEYLSSIDKRDEGRSFKEIRADI